MAHALFAVRDGVARRRPILPVVRGLGRRLPRRRSASSSPSCSSTSSGSTAHADGADPEDVRDRNQLYYREARDRIERHGGTIEKYVGDAVMAVFGAPLARSDDAERAVRAALSILEGIAALNERDPGLDLRVRAAVCTGEAIVSVDAAPADALATGDVVNTAARLQSAAPTDRVVVGAETYRLTRHAFDYRELEAVDAKGKRDPVPRMARGAFARGAGGATDVDDAARRTGPRGAADPNGVGSAPSPRARRTSSR